MSRLTLLSLLLCAGCIENSFSGNKGDPEPFDPGDSDPVDPVDTESDTGGPIDTGGGDGELPECKPRSFPAQPLDPFEDCEGGARANPAWVLQNRWEIGDLGWMISSPVMVNLTDDNGNGRIDDGDVPDVIAAPYTGGIYALNGADGSTIWSVGSSQIEQSTPAVGDVDYDGWPEVFVQGLYGSKLISGVDGTTVWEGRAPSSIKTYCGGPAIADLEGDGDVEITFGRLILDGPTGATEAEGNGGQGTSIPGEGPISVPADIDLDGELELVAGNTVYEPDGSKLWYNSSERDGFPAIGNFDSDPEAEILVGQQGSATLYDTDGSRIWSYSLPGYSGPPAVADVDGDGVPEALIPHQSGIAVLNADGEELWTYSHTSGSLYDGVSAYDFDGDGDWEVVLNWNGGIYLFDGPSGDLIDSYNHGGLYACGQEATMADVDNDGHADIAYTFGATYGGAGGVGLLSDEDGFAAALSTWNQHQYSITNIENDGQVPTEPEPNWLDINNFRAGPPIDYVFEDQNLVGRIYDLCVDRCGLDEITVWWALGNNGSGEIDEDIVVDFYGETDAGEVLLYSTLWTAALPAGWMAEAQQTTLYDVPTPLYDIRMALDGGNNSTQSEVSECGENDNEMMWGALICL